MLMGMERLASIVSELLENGADPSLPVALIRWGTTGRQQTLIGELGSIVKAAVGFEPPAIAVFGRVVELRDKLSWFERRPLFGRRIVVTRTRKQASELTAKLRVLGADVYELPTIRVEPPDNLPLASRLLGIHEGLAAVLGDFRPAEAAVEQTFVNKDGVATLKLGQARGVAMLAPAMFGISVAEYAPNQVKKTVVGAGHADKNQILMMLKILLPKAEPKSPDAADALAVAITHAHHRQSTALRLRVVEA